MLTKGLGVDLHQFITEVDRKLRATTCRFARSNSKENLNNCLVDFAPAKVNDLLAARFATNANLGNTSLWRLRQDHGGLAPGYSKRVTAHKRSLIALLSEIEHHHETD